MSFYFISVPHNRKSALPIYLSDDVVWAQRVFVHCWARREKKPEWQFVPRGDRHNLSVGGRETLISPRSILDHVFAYFLFRSSSKWWRA